MHAFFSFAFVCLALPVAYLYLLAVAALRTRSVQPSKRPRHRFAVTIPAHNEEPVIGRTVETLRKMDYPPSLFDIHVVADHCSDGTARVARAAGATVHERLEGPRGGKGTALRWLFSRILRDRGRTLPSIPYDAVVVFDADTQVAPEFLRVMDAHLQQGAQVIQGQHRISNPGDGWLPMLTWAMFMVDNRFGNMGRSNLGFSAKNMGDSICFRADVLRRLGWGEGLTEDYGFRQQLLLDGVKIRYEPAAMGWGEAAANWSIARAQRARWLRGTHDASQQYARRLLVEAIRRRDAALLDGALQAHFPSYSTLTVVAASVRLALSLAATGSPRPPLAPWTLLLVLLVAYPVFGLVLERAPRRAYLAILSGPVFVVWRTWLALTSRFGRGDVKWIRTPRKVQ